MAHDPWPMGNVLDDTINLIAIDRDIEKKLWEQEDIFVVNNKEKKKPWLAGFENKMCFMVNIKFIIIRVNQHYNKIDGACFFDKRPLTWVK